MFGIFAIWYYFFPKITRRTYSDFLGVAHFWLSLISTAILLPQSIVTEGIRWVTVNSIWALRASDIWNLVSSIGSYVWAAGILIFFANVALAFLRRRPTD